MTHTQKNCIRKDIGSTNFSLIFCVWGSTERIGELVTYFNTYVCIYIYVSSITVVKHGKII